MPSYFPKPGAVPSAFLGTFTDFVDHVTWFAGGSALAKGQYGVRKAVEIAYRAIVQARDWRYFQTDGRIVTNAPYSTGTIEYTHATRTLTLTGGTWPTWAALGRVKIGSVICEVDSRTSGADLILSNALNPGANVASGTAYVLFQEVYPMPADFRNIRDPGLSADGITLQYIPAAEWLRLARAQATRGTPRYWTTWSTHSRYGGMAIGLYPYPDSAATIDFAYQRYARPILRTGYGTEGTAGVVSCPDNTVTGSGTVFTTSMVGSVLRFGTAAAIPTGIAGTNPYSDQQIITNVSSAGLLTIDAAPGLTYTDVKYVISDPIDLPEYMHNAFLRQCELEAVRLMQLPKVQDAEHGWMIAMEGAMAADNVAVGPSATGGWASYLPWWEGHTSFESY